MREGVGADDGLVGLHRVAGDLRHQLGGGHDLGGVDAGLDREDVGAGAHRHDDLLERGVAGTFAEAVDRALDLAGARAHRGQRVGHGQPEVVVAMHRPHYLVRVGHALDQRAYGGGELLGHVVAHGVGHVDGLRAGVDHGLEDADQKVDLGATGVFGGELDVVGVFARPADRLDRLRDDLVGRHAQLLLHVDRAGGDEGVDAPARRRADGLAGAADVVLVGARQRTDGGLLDRLGDRAHRLEVAVGGGGEAGLDDVHAHTLELAGDAQLLVTGHRRARALLAVAQGGVEDDQLVFHGLLPGSDEAPSTGAAAVSPACSL